MTLPRYEPEDVQHRRWVRGIEAELVAQAPMRVPCRYDGDAVPFDVATPARAMPLAVLCLSATQRDDRSRTESGARVTWAWVGGERGVVRVHAIDLTSATAEYDIVLALERS